MKLVKIENYQVVVEDELLLLKPFRKLYNADRTVGKSKFMDFMTILYYVYDPRSDYSYIADEEGRLKAATFQPLSVPAYMCGAHSATKSPMPFSKAARACG